MPDAVTEFLTTIWRALGGEANSGALIEFTGEGALPSVFAVTDLAAASIGAAALAVADYAGAGDAMTPAVSVDRRLASFWFGFSLKPIGWSLPPAWDAIAGDYACADGWIKLHTICNSSHRVCPTNVSPLSRLVFAHHQCGFGFCWKRPSDPSRDR